MLNPEIAEAMDASECYLMDEDAYREYLQRESVIWDYNNDINGSREEGHEEEKQNTILRLWRKKKSLADMIDATDWTAEQINSFLRSQNLQPAK